MSKRNEYTDDFSKEVKNTGVVNEQDEYTDEFWDEFFEETPKVDISEIESRIAAIRAKQENDSEEESCDFIEDVTPSIGLITPAVDEKFKDKAEDIDSFIETNKDKLKTIYFSQCDIFGSSDEAFEAWLCSEECLGVVESLMAAPVNIMDSISPTPNVNECSYSGFDNKVLELSDKIAEIMDIVMKEAREQALGVAYHSRIIDKLLKKFTYQVKAYNEEIKLQEELY